MDYPEIQKGNENEINLPVIRWTIADTSICIFYPFFCAYFTYKQMNVSLAF